MNKNSSTNRYKQRLLPVLRQIQEELDSELHLASLAQMAQMSQYHFHRIFKAIVGENLKQHVRRLRLERAATQLRDTERRILDIAIEAGFASHEAFSRAFNVSFEMTPLDYRNNPPVFLSPPSRIGFGTPVHDFTMNEYGDVRMQVEQIYLPEVTVLYRHHIGADDNMPEAWSEMVRWGHAEQLIDQDTRFITIGHDDPTITEPKKQRFDLCFTSESQVRGSFPVKSRKIAGFKVARVIHEGDLSGIESTFMAFYGRWLPDSGLEPADHPPLVEYLNSPFNTPTDELRTALYIPLKSS